MAAKILRVGEIGVHDEASKLVSAALTGLPSVEQELLQLLRTEDSLFLGHMDVMAARHEISAFYKTLESHGVSVIMMKEALANILMNSGQGALSMSDTMSALSQKAKTLTSLNLEVPSPDLGLVLGKAETLIQMDAELYGGGKKGMQKALLLVKALCIDPKLPHGNLLYARDQSSVVLGHRVVSAMMYPARQSEVPIFESIYHNILPMHPVISIPEGETFEGGSLYVNGNKMFIDVGPRTSMGAAKWIISTLASSGKYPGMEYVIVKEEGKPPTFEQEQESMHLDMFSMPIGLGDKKQMVLCPSESDRRHVYLASADESGIMRIHRTGKTFTEYLSGEGYDLIRVTKEEQRAFACNILALDGTTVVSALPFEAPISEALRDRGKNVINLDFSATTEGTGGPHCLTMQLLRK